MDYILFMSQIFVVVFALVVNIIVVVVILVLLFSHPPTSGNLPLHVISKVEAVVVIILISFL